jgi:hypothetical protein
VLSALGVVLVVVVALVLLGLLAAAAALFWLIRVRVEPAYEVPKAAPGLDAQEIGRALDGAVRMSSGRLPPQLQAKVTEIRQEILALLPSTAGFPLGSEDLYVIQRTATDYLPSTLQAYLALPAEYASSRKLEGGKTPLELLGDQLQLLDDRLDEIKDAVHEQDADRLVANGRFLEERFGREPGRLQLPPADQE